MIKILTILLSLSTFCANAQNVVVDGNSLTASPLGYGQYIHCTNIAVNGQSTVEMLNRFDTLYKLYQPGKVNILVAWEISNDLFEHGSTESALFNFITYCQKAKSVGYKVVILSVLPRWNGANTEYGQDSATFNTKIDIINNYLSIDWCWFADVFIDLRKQKELATINSTYYLPDGTHLNRYGDSIIYKLIQSEIDKYSTP